MSGNEPRSPTNKNSNLIQVRLDRELDIIHVASKGSERAAWLRAVISTACRVERNGGIDFLNHEREVTKHTADEVEDKLDAATDQVPEPPESLTPNYTP